MKPERLSLTLVFVFSLALAGASRAQPVAATEAQSLPIRFPPVPATSPICTNIQRFGFSEIAVVYSRPSMRQHTIFGGIVPYNIIWRTGDNASTKVTFSTPVRVGGQDGKELPAGTYALYTIPDDRAWTVIFSKDTSLFGTEGYDIKKDAVRFKVAPVKTIEAVETFTIDINNLQDDSATINLSWARVRVPIKVETDIVGDTLIKIKASMDSPIRKTPNTYLQAATFYCDHTKDAKDMAQALAWLNTGLTGHPAIEYQLLYIKARVLAKMGNRDEAIAAANQSSELARAAEGPGTPYFKMNQEVIAGLR
jgi:hypothetical protein